MWVCSGPFIYFSRFPLVLVDGKIHFSLLLLSESQRKMDGDKSTHTHARKYKSISSTNHHLFVAKYQYNHVAFVIKKENKTMHQIYEPKVSPLVNTCLKCSRKLFVAYI
jgi:hypothetical protein